MNLAKSLMFLVFCALIVNAKADPIDSALTKCQHDSQTTAGSIQCLNAAITQWDEALNKAYKQLQGLLVPGDRDKLKVAQLKWISFRDAEKQFINDSYSGMKGSIYRVYLLENVLELTKSRTMQLRQYSREMREGKGDI